MVETSHKSRSPGRLLNWAWPSKKRRESHPPPSISISDTSGRLERAATLQGEPLLHGTPPRRQSDASFSVGDPSSTTSSMSGSRRSTKTSIREFFTRRSQSGPAGTPSTSSTPPLTQQQQLQQLQHQQAPSAAAMQPAPLSTTSPSATRSKLPSPVTSPVSRAMDVNDQYKIPSHLLPESPPHIPTPVSSNIPPLSTSPTATATHHHRLSLLHPLLHLSELSHHHGSHQGSIAGSQYTPSSSSLMLAPQKEEMEEPPLSMEDTKRIALRQDLIRLAFDGWFKSPLGPDQDRKVLHIGCGDGAWCLAASKAYPNWYFYGVDDSTGGPFMASAVRYRNSVINAGGLEDLTTLPINAHGNFQFIRASSTLLEGLEWIPDGYFDLVYGQCLLMSMPRRDYEAMVSHAWRVCKPGGFVELTELDLTLYGQLPLGRLTRWLNHRGKKYILIEIFQRTCWPLPARN
ncbi:S-adenosyl-L-methionine-dependent methyltransferase [Gongronella butleri]|nr:S-adenosyl-L-methionine-dependent methyltransferase [Gongronella butleri]